MSELLVLLSPSANRVYAGSAPSLVAAEIRCLTTAFVDGEVEVAPVSVGGVDYVQVSTSAAPGTDVVRILSNLSATYALFEQAGDLLRPIDLDRVDRYPSDLLTIQKYPGKTNEQLTRLLLNVTAAATQWPSRLYDGRLTVLDPMCGRGTTLNLAMTYGLDVTGIDLDRKDFEAYEAFIKTWLRSHRLKHTAVGSSLRTAGRARGRRLDIEVAPAREAFKAGQVHQVTYLNTDTTDLDRLLRAASYDVIVTDTPYGVQHGSHGDRIARNPLQLLETALPSWVRLLRSGGAIGLSYNRHVAPPAALAELLSCNGLSVVRDPESEDFRHRVDASIDRDVIVARKG